MHFVDVILQEITTEGLDGITLENLWAHLSFGDSVFPLTVDENCKEFIWKTIVSLKCVDFYVNPSVVKVTGPFDRRKWLVDNEAGLYYDIPPEFRLDRFHPVNDPTESGSCLFHTTRVAVTDDIRNNQTFHVLKNVVSKWGDYLVIVASQQERSNLLLGNRANLKDVSSLTYVLLEAAAKARFNGLPTMNIDGLAASGLTPSTIWYSRNRLESIGLITAQPYVSRHQSQPLTTGLLLHHWRYFREFTFPNIVLLKKIIQMLQKMRRHACLAAQIKHSLGLTAKAVKRILCFAVREGFLTTAVMQLTGCCSFFLGKPESEIGNAELAEFVQEYSLPRNSASQTFIVVKLNDASITVESWLAKFGRGKGKKRFDTSGFNSDEDEEDAEAESLDQSVGESSATLLSGAAIDCDDSMVEDSLHYNGQQLENFRASSDSVTSYNHILSDETQHRNMISLVSCRKMLSTAPQVNSEDSLPMQLARLLLPQELTLPSLLKKTLLEYFTCRRVLRTFDVIAVTRIIKRSLEATFVLYHQFLTDAERTDHLKSEKVSQGGGLKNVQALNVQTQRRKRREFILNYVAQHRVITSISELRHSIWNHEESMGMKTRMDYKSFHRILEDLIKLKQVVVHPFKTIQGDVRVLCLADIRREDPVVAKAIQDLEENITKDRVRCGQFRSADNLLLNRTCPRLSEKAMQIIRVRLLGCPRLKRRALLHQFLFYVVYHLSELTKPVHPATTTVPAVYHDEYSWRRFVGPLNAPKGMPRGWFSVNDLIRSLPLGLFLHLANFPSMPAIMCRWLGMNRWLQHLSVGDLAGLDSQITCDREQNAPLAELFLYPLDRIRPPGGFMGRLSGWMLSEPRLRWFVSLLEEFSIHNLVSLYHTEGNANAKNMSQLFGYLHKNASLLDTRYGPPGYHILSDLNSCSFLRFRFNTCSDVASYWQTCELICRNTPLGSRVRKVLLDSVTLPSATRKSVLLPEDLVVVDDGNLPFIEWPDKSTCSTAEGCIFSPCGACGFHPLDFSFYPRQWDRKVDKLPRDDESSDESEADNVSIMEPSEVWTVQSSDRVPLHPEEYFWQWSQRLFDDVELPYDFAVQASMEKQNGGSFIKSRRKYGIVDMSKRYLSRMATFSRIVGEENTDTSQKPLDSVHSPVPMVTDDCDNANHPSSVQTEAPVVDGSTRRPFVVNEKQSKLQKYTHAVRKARKTLQSTSKSARPARSNSSDGTHRPVTFRSIWTAVDDQLLVVCRVASLLITGCGRKEVFCVPRNLIEEIIRIYSPQTGRVRNFSSLVRRLKLVLYAKSAEGVATHLLLNRVARNSELQASFNFGWKRWRDMLRKSPSAARKVFLDAVSRIVTEFVPQLNHIRTSKSARNKLTCTSQSKNSSSPSSGLSSSVKAIEDPISEVRITGTRAELETRFTVVSVQAKQTWRGIDDVGRSRVAVVVHTLYMYTMSSFRLIKEHNNPFQMMTFTPILRQYPRIQLAEALNVLLASRLVTPMKFFAPIEDFRLVVNKRLKLSQRFQVWGFHEFHNQSKHIRLAQLLMNRFRSRLQLLKDDSAIIAEPIMEHRFDGQTNSGSVAFFSEMLLLEQSVYFKMHLKVSDIEFVGDEDMYRAIQDYENRFPSSEKTAVNNVQSHISSSSCATKCQRPKGLLNRSLLHEIQKAPACFGDPRFWFESGYNRRFRWFDHHLSFSSGTLEMWPKQLDSSQHEDRSLVTSSFLMEHHFEPLLDSVLSTIVPSLDFKLESTEPIGERVTVAQSLEKFIVEGRFTGRTSDELKEEFGDNHEVVSALNNMLTDKTVFWLGSTVSRFVHYKYIRLWMIHVKPAVQPKLPLHSETEPDVKRIRTDSSPSVQNVNDSTSVSSSAVRSDSKRFQSVQQTLGFFFPELWYNEEGQLKPRQLCSFLQAVVVHLTQNPGTTLSRFAPDYQLLFGQQVVRRLIYWLQDLGAVRIFRLIGDHTTSLFSPPPSYSVSDRLTLACADELTLVPSPNCISIVGSFCEQLLFRCGDTQEPVNFC